MPHRVHTLDAAYSYRRVASCLSVVLSGRLLVTRANRAKTDEPIEMPFGVRSCGPPNHALDGALRVHIDATWQMGLIDVCGGGDADCHCHFCGNLFLLLFGGDI